MTGALSRRLGLLDAVTVGLSSMIGAGVFAAFAPAAAAAGTGLLVALGVAAVVAYCNAMSSARLAARYPRSGGTYVYGRERLGPFWGYLAGFSFVVGKTASCAAMALTAGLYLWPQQAHLVAAVAVAALTALSCSGIQRTALTARLIVVAVLAVLAVVVVAIAVSGRADPAHLQLAEVGAGGVLQAAGLLFFAFAGYARIATLGEEVRDPARVIPAAIPLALGITLVVYTAVAVAVLAALGAQALAGSAAPLSDAVAAVGLHGLDPVVRAGAALAALGALLALILGVSRTALAMARDGHLPARLASVSGSGVPRTVEVTVGIVVAVLAATADLRAALGFSSFGVLVYYAIANCSAWSLRRSVIPVAGLFGCVVLAVTLPRGSVLTGAAVLAAGAALYGIRAALRARRA
ncbi:APC family permease [Mycolicibacterium palauense]|uniref:APC family permease n=1 Tax=Mycolicibacterium palauense TaxID=2034511 RepID=UPI000BFEAE55|nr:APC family permease [Mycolicibacterium palauense]